MRRMEDLASVSTFILILLLASCATKRSESRLDPLSEDFYDKVRYIIVREESKIFLELPPSARVDFIEEFWKRREEQRSVYIRLENLSGDQKIEKLLPFKM
jgi:hypothetical protein